MFTGFGFIPWRSSIIADAQIIMGIITSVSNMLFASPEDHEKWQIRNSIMHTPIFQSVAIIVRQTLGSLDESSAFGLCQQVTCELLVSLVQERTLVTRELFSLTL